MQIQDEELLLKIGVICIFAFSSNSSYFVLGLPWLLLFGLITDCSLPPLLSHSIFNSDSSHYCKAVSGRAVLLLYVVDAISAGHSTAASLQFQMDMLLEIVMLKLT